MARLSALVVLSLVLPLVVFGQTGNTPPPNSPPPNQPNAKGEKTTPAARAPAMPPDSTALELTKKVKASYPIEAEPGRLQGQVTIEIIISENGHVERAEAVSGNPVLAKAAIDAVKKWKFKPFFRNGEPVKVSTKLTFDFAYSENVKDIQPGAATEIKLPPGPNGTGRCGTTVALSALHP